MFSVRVFLSVLLSAALVAAAIAYGPTAAWAEHKCDPVTDAGWSVVPAEETIGQVDGTPFQEGASGNWFIDPRHHRAAVLPLL